MTSEAKTPEDLRYTKTHEWVRIEGDQVTIGITDHAQSELTDIVFVDLPAVGKPVQAGVSALVLESVKTVADIYAPGDGHVSAVNSALKSEPGLINKDPYGAGWIYRIQLDHPIPSERLMDAAAYRAVAATHG